MKQIPNTVWSCTLSANIYCPIKPLLFLWWGEAGREIDLQLYPRGACGDTFS